MRVTSYLELGEKVVVCCSHGMNRSNSIALGVLVQYFKMDFFKALELIQSKVPICTKANMHEATHYLKHELNSMTLLTQRVINSALSIICHV